jgi:hypothetical protein
MRAKHTEINGKELNPNSILDQIFGTKKSVIKTKNPDEYLKKLNEMNSAELQEHVAENYGRIPPQAQSKEDRRRLIAICMKEFKKITRGTISQEEEKKPSPRSQEKATNIFRSFNL